MATLLEEIQRAATDPKLPVSALLRKVKIAAAKLGLDGVEQWVDHELKGYKGSGPEYRFVGGTPSALNPINGWIPLVRPPDALCRMFFGEPVAAVEAMLENAGNDDFVLEYSSKLCAALDEGAALKFHRYGMRVSRGQIVKCIDGVRDAVADWTIRLEKAGVRGSDFSFSEDDKRMAKAAPTIHIAGNFSGNLVHGNTTGDITSTNGLDGGEVKALLAEMRKAQAELVKATGSTVVVKRFDELEAELAKAAPDTSRLTSILVDVRNAVSGATGNLAAMGIGAWITRLIGA